MRRTPGATLSSSFFLIIPRPPRSTLIPSTTLFRSLRAEGVRDPLRLPAARPLGARRLPDHQRPGAERGEAVVRRPQYLRKGLPAGRSAARTASPAVAIQRDPIHGGVARDRKSVVVGKRVD